MFKKIISFLLVIIVFTSTALANNIYEKNSQLLDKLIEDTESIDNYEKLIIHDFKCIANMYLNIAKEYNGENISSEINDLESKLFAEYKDDFKAQEEYMYVALKSLYYIAELGYEDNTDLKEML